MHLLMLELENKSFIRKDALKTMKTNHAIMHGGSKHLGEKVI